MAEGIHRRKRIRVPMSSKRSTKRFRYDGEVESSHETSPELVQRLTVGKGRD